MTSQPSKTTAELRPARPDSAEALIRDQAAQKKTLSPKERTTVARNVFKILERAKNEGISKRDLAKRMHLGQGEAKDLHPFYLPPEKNDRRLIAKAEGYIKLIESLASIDGHSRSGATSDLLREVFVGTPYWDRDAFGEDIVSDLYSVIKRCEAWLLKDGEIEEAYKFLNRLGRPDEQKNCLSEFAESIYKMTFYYPRSVPDYARRPPLFYLGASCSPVCDEYGKKLVLTSEHGRIVEVCNAINYYLYLGPSSDGDIALQLAKEKTLKVQGVVEEDWVNVDFIGDRAYGDERETYIQSVEGFRQNITEQSFLDLIGDPAQFCEQYAFEPGTKTFVELASNIKQKKPDYGFLKPSPNAEIRTLTMDCLDDFNATVSTETIALFPLLGIPIDQPDLQVRYGRGPLTQLLAAFLYPWIEENIIENIEVVRKYKIHTKGSPANGWMHPESHADGTGSRSYWSLPDVLWLKKKLFCRLVKSGFRAESAKAEERLASTYEKFNS